MRPKIFDYYALVLLVLSALLSAAIWARDNKGNAAGWLVGCTFGLAIGIPLLNNYEFLAALIVVSGGTFVLAAEVAGQIIGRGSAPLFATPTPAKRIRDWTVDAVAGAIAGAIGALMVSAALKVILGISLEPRTETFEAGVGAFCGALFMQQLPRCLPEWLRCAAAFLVWQIPVGLVLSWNVNLVPPDERSPIIADRLRVLLTGPTVQIIGVVGSIASIVSLLRQNRDRS